METRKIFVTGAIAGASVCALIVACSNSSPATTPNDNPTPPGTTPVAAPPFPACATLEPGSFTTNGNGAYTTPASTSCTPAGQPTPVSAANPADSHCAGQAPQAVAAASCSVSDAGPPPSEDAGPAPTTDSGAAADAGPVSDDAGALPVPGPCEENGPDYGATQYGTEADDDDCKYHVAYTASPICQNNGTYFVVTATQLAQNNAPLTNASTFAELCQSNTHPAPAVDARPPTGKQQVVEGPPGTYTIGPVVFDAPGDWTVRFHFNEYCCDGVGSSPHGHAAFHLTVP